jgi:small conductance mechanosensitive channel
MLFADVATILQQLGLTNLKAKVDRYILQTGPEVAANVVAAIVIFFIGKWVARFAERLLQQLLTRAKIDETLSKFLCRIGYMVVMCAVALAALEKLGVNTTSLTAVLAAAGLAVGLALQGSLSNFAAGVMIILFRPFKVGDFIEAAGTKGIVDEIHVFHTMMRTPDNIDIVVPNSSITTGNITNYSSQPTRRIDLVVGCGYGDDLLAVKRFLEGVVRGDTRILRDPAPVVAVHELGESSVNFVVRPWVRNADYWTTRWDLIEQIKMGFDEHGFTIPFPQRDLHLHGPSESVALMRHAVEGPVAMDSFDSAPAPDRIVPSPAVDDGLLRPRRVA